MKQSIKKQCAENLYDTMGGIQDIYISEANTWRSRPVERTSPIKHNRHKLRNGLIAAGLCLFVTIASLNAIRNISQNATGGSDNEGHEQSELTVNACIAQMIETGSAVPFRKQDLSITPGAAYIVVEDVSAQQYYRSGNLSDSTQSAVLTALSQSSLTQVAPNRTDDIYDVYKIWIVLSNGCVVSPCLKQSAGNTSIGSLFDYNAEVIPSDAFLQTLLKL